MCHTKGNRGKRSELLIVLFFIIFLLQISHARVNEHIYAVGLNNFGKISTNSLLGQLGLTDTTDRTYLSKLSHFGENIITDYACGSDTVIYISQPNRVYTFGRNSAGQCGLGHEIDQIKPIEVPDLIGKNITKIAKNSGSEFFIVYNDDEIYGMGMNERAELCSFDRENKNRPFQITWFKQMNIKVKFISTGGLGSTFLTNEGQIYHCGFTAGGGNKPFHYPFFADKGIVDIGVGQDYMIALGSNGQLYGVGSSIYGQLGRNRSELIEFPALNEFISNVSTMWVGIAHTIVNTAHGFYGFGQNDGGSLGLGHRDPVLIPTRLPFLTDPNTIIGIGKDFTIYRSQQKLYGMGKNYLYALGIENVNQVNQPFDEHKTPIHLPFFNNISIKTIRCGQSNSMIQAEDRKFYSMGACGYGQAGTGDVIVRIKPTPAYSLISNTIHSIDCGYSHTLWLDMNGYLYSGGGNSYGQLGLGDWHYRAEPNRNQFLENEVITFISAGAYFSYVLTANKTMWSFGDNKFGQLGIGNTQTQTRPTQVKFFDGLDVKAMSCGTYHVIFLIEPYGEVYVVGRNNFGQLGQPLWSLIATRPLLVRKLQIIKIVDVSAGYGHNLLIEKEGKLYCFGNNAHGQCGTGTTWPFQDPDQVSEPNQILRLKNTTILQARAGHSHSILLTSDGRVLTMGRNNFGQIGDRGPEQVLQPYSIDFFSDKRITHVIPGNHFNLVRTSDMHVYAFGINTMGQLGTGNLTSPQYEPIFISDKVMFVAAGYGQSFFEFEEDLSCFGISSTLDTVCSSRGVCKGYNSCDCKTGWSGEKCDIPVCYGLSGLRINACHNHGKCIGVDRCECNVGQWGGSECSIPLCFGILNSDPNTCNGHGNCTGPNTCKCSNGWTGRECQIPVCFDIEGNEPGVCNRGNGTCTAPDVCSCKIGYFGDKCQNMMCFEKNSTSSNVCSGVGTCTMYNRCACPVGSTGSECEHSVCFNINSNSTKVCSSVGKCVKPDGCVCPPGTYGEDCSFKIYILALALFYVACLLIMVLGLVANLCDVNLIRSRFTISQKRKFDWKMQPVSLTNPLLDVTGNPRSELGNTDLGSHQ